PLHGAQLYEVVLIKPNILIRWVCSQTNVPIRENLFVQVWINSLDSQAAAVAVIVVVVVVVVIVVVVLVVVIVVVVVVVIIFSVVAVVIC
ncbi:hypothetical protein ElyMa_004311600, partial [Elysia marginata]